VQSERKFYKKFLRKISLIRVFFSKWEQDELTLVGICVNNCLVIRNDKQIEKLIVDLRKNGYKLKVGHDLNDYLSCHIIEDFRLNQILTLQPRVINNLEANLERKFKQRDFTRILGHQDPKSSTLMMTITLLILIYNQDANLELECFYFKLNIQDLIFATL
jgi:hypothetical protein